MIEFLRWDSDFFGMKIGKINLNSVEEINRFNAGDYDLIYLLNDHENDEINGLLSNLGAVKYDTKIVFTKEIEPIRNFVDDGNIEIADKLNDKLLDLSYQSGWCSRFYLDKSLSNKFQQMYQIWMSNYINKLSAVTYKYMVDNEIAGMINCEVNGTLGSIGLFAVDGKYRRMGIAGKLLRKVEQFYLSNNVTNCEVVTQGDNLPAVNTYLKYGYKIKNSTNVWHWSKGSVPVFWEIPVQS